MYRLSHKRPRGKKLIIVSALAITAVALSATPMGRTFARSLLSALPFIKQESLRINSSITLIKEEDRNKNGQIDAGDGVRFSYSIENSGKASVANAVLKTGINRDRLNFIRNTQGAPGIDYESNTIDIPNISLGPRQKAAIAFDARLTYGLEDNSLSTHPKVMSNSKLMIQGDESIVAINKGVLPKEFSQTNERKAAQ